MQLADGLLWIEGTWAARFVATAPFVYPLLSALHLLGIALVVGSIVPVDLRLLRLVGPQLDPALPLLVRTAVLGFAVAGPSGLLLASVRVADYAENPAFLTKMVVLLVAGANALLLRLLSVSWNGADLAGGVAGRIAAALSLCLWVAALFAGRWIAFA